jgi:N6-adenosine-specific RNA methylase IME4
VKEHANKVEVAKANPQKDTFNGPFDIILSDPPWRYDFSETKNREIENHYPTATVEEIKKHKPNSADDSILFLWATAPKLKEALEVMEAWGFGYVTHAIWDKQIVGMGYWFRGQHELLLVGTKGKATCTPECERQSSVFSEKRSKHSAKPECVYEWIERAFPDKSKLEMYCRTPRKNWSVWGNEV